VSLVTLSTDFGTRDSYVAELKGVLYSEGPAALRVVDLSHALAPFDVRGAALFVRAALPRFPAGSVHVVVVDPGVGSARRAIAASVRGQLLVGPDNGVFGLLYDGREQVHEITPDARVLASTFHGRDLFAPAAARLSAGAPLASLGPRVDAYERIALPAVEERDGALHGEVIHVDRFGNLITNIEVHALTVFAGERAPGTLRVEVAGHALHGLRDHYAQVAAGELIALIGSGGLLEVAEREGDAAQRLAARVGSSVRVLR
jgi:S-adenosylmethionine hydrolase